MAYTQQAENQQLNQTVTIKHNNSTGWRELEAQLANVLGTGKQQPRTSQRLTTYQLRAERSKHQEVNDPAQQTPIK